MVEEVKAKSKWKSKTLWWNVLFMIGALLTAFLSSGLLTTEFIAILTIINTVVNVILRTYFTTNPLQ